MIIVKILGGLGNQMFQYAFARELAYVNQATVYLDCSQFADYRLHGGFQLESVFRAPYDKAPAAEARRLSTAPLGLASRLRRKYFTKRTHIIDTWFNFNPAVLRPRGDVYYDGYWQSEKYFIDVVDEIRGVFDCAPLLSERGGSYLANADRPLCAIHVRRGDFLQSANMNVCGLAYYRRAIAHLAENAICRHFAVFSDDIPWCRANLVHTNTVSGINIDFIDWDQTAGEDLALMAACDHQIIANSSFSWWAAYLNPNPIKTVVAPEVWNRRQLASKDRYYHFNYSDVVPGAWIRLPV